MKTFHIMKNHSENSNWKKKDNSPLEKEKDTKISTTEQENLKQILQTGAFMALIKEELPNEKTGEAPAGYNSIFSCLVSWTN